jgi:DNA helicase-2/ATP-dependent DNA helicase PcrA
MLYRTNSQSRLFEEAMRRYQLKYHVVGGFSFYDRAEIKDLISYLKLIHNVDDSIALLRVINTPVRGIGRTTMETVEQIALETGVSLWGAIGEAIRRQLLPQRAVAALKSFRSLIEDGRAMLAGSFVERLETTAEAAELRSAGQPLRLRSGQAQGAGPERVEEIGEDTNFDPENFTFDFHPSTDSSAGDAPAVEGPSRPGDEAATEPFRAPGAAANTGEILKFLIVVTGYIKHL